MIKKKLLSLPVLKPTAAMKKAAEQDIGTKETVRNVYCHSWERTLYKYNVYYRAKVTDGILHIAIYNKRDLMKGGREPDVILFIDKREQKYLSYIAYEKRWSEATIEYLYEYSVISSAISQDGRSRFEGNWIPEKERKLVFNYLKDEETGASFQGINLQEDAKKDVREIIWNYQKRQVDILKREKQRKEISEIDAVMNQVPKEIPKGVETWLIRHGMREHFGMMMPKERDALYRATYCTACEKWSRIDLEYAKHNMKDIPCPKCHEPLILKDWNRQQLVRTQDQIFVIQKMKDGDGYVARKFDVIAMYRKEYLYRPELVLDEYRRKTFGGSVSRLYAYDKYKNGEIRWIHGEHQKRGNPYSGYFTMILGDGIVYPKNLKKVFSREIWKNTRLERCFGIHPRPYQSGKVTEYTDPVAVYGRLNTVPQLEYLDKCGLNRLMLEVLFSNTHRCSAVGELFDNNAGKITEYLKLDKQRLNRLKEIDGGSCALAALQWEAKQGEKLSKEMLAMINEEELSLDDLQMERTGLTLTRAVGFRKRQMERYNMDGYSFRITYRDYLDMAEERGSDITEDIIRTNPRMKEFHDQYAEEKVRRRDKDQDKAYNKRFRKIAEDYIENKNYFEYIWEKKGYRIVVPKRASDIRIEGRRQHHCVGSSDTYMKRMAEHESFIVFLRKCETPKTPYYTIEVKADGTIKQFYAAYDKQPNRQQVEKLLKPWSKKLKKQYEEKQCRVQVTVAAG